MQTNELSWLWIPDSRHSASQTRVNALEAASGTTPSDMISDRKAFIRANTRLKPVAHVPEISLHVAEESVPIWQKTEEELDAMGLPRPTGRSHGRADRRWRAM